MMDCDGDSTISNDVDMEETIPAGSIRKRKTSARLKKDSPSHDVTMCPTEGSWYRLHDGSALLVDKVDKEIGLATCQHFSIDDLKSRFRVKPRQTEKSFEELSRSVDPHWICTLGTKEEFAIYKNRQQHEKVKNRARRNRKKRPRVLELFAGAGGMTHGFRKAKFDIPWSVEKNCQAAGTHRANFPKTLQGNGIVFSECVNSFISKAKADDKGYPKPEEVDHVHASPPCQGFSDANRNGGQNDQANNEMSFAIIDAVQHFEPHTATYENVMGLFKHRHVLNYIIGNLICLGYQVRLTVLLSSEYGDPQNRHRIVIFAAKENFPLPERPLPTHGKGLMEKQTVGDVLAVLDGEPPVSGKGGVIGVMAGGKMIIIEDHRAPSTVPDEDNKNLKKLDAGKPARTIRSARCYIHPEEHRLLSVREHAILQSLPTAHVLCGSEDSKYRQIGNAVPVRTAIAVARSVANSYGIP